MSASQVQHRSLAPVLIVGHGSSGTSILSRLLRNYLRISFGTESQFIVRYFQRLDQYGDLGRDENLRRLIRDLLGERWFDRCRAKWGWQPDSEVIFRRVEPRTFRGVLDTIFFDLARHNQMAPRWGDKTPEYTHDLDVLGRLFPEAKYVHLVRDGRDVALSVMDRYWGPKNVYSAACEWEESVTQIDEFFRRNPELQTIEITYEQLLGDPVATFRRLIEFLEIEDRDGAFLQSLADDLRRDLMSDNFDKWRRLLSPKQRALFERVAGDVLRRHGYETLDGPAAVAGISTLARAYWACDNKLRKWTYARYWQDNAYKVRLRSRDLLRTLRTGLQATGDDIGDRGQGTGDRE